MCVVISNEGRNRDRVGPFFSLFRLSVRSKFALLNFVPVFLDVLVRLPHALNWLPLFQTLFWFLILFELNNEYDTGCSALDANPRLLISLVLLLLFETGVLFVEIWPSVVWELPNSWLLLSFRHLIRPCVSMSTMANRILDFMTNAIALLNWHLILTCPLDLQYPSKSVETYWLLKFRLYFYFPTLNIQSDLTEHRYALWTILLTAS
jgi:hypothetical protein